jgi:hypothetical protein
LATYLFANPGLTDMCGDDDMMDDGVCENVGSSHLFLGGDQYGHFMACLHRVIENNLEEFLLLGIKPGDSGSYSARKGASSFASAGSTMSPPMVSICLQAMWSMGPVKERYLQYEKAGDQYLEQVVSGLDVNNVSFAVSPPYFKSGIEDDVSKKINNLLKAFTVGGGNLSGEVFQVLYFCFASLCYHFDYLVAITSKQSKLQASPFSLTSQITQGKPLLSSSHGPRLHRRPPSPACHLMFVFLRNSKGSRQPLSRRRTRLLLGLRVILTGDGWGRSCILTSRKSLQRWQSFMSK